MDEWDVMAAVRALRRDVARRRREDFSSDQMMRFVARRRLSLLRSCLGTIHARAELRDFAVRHQG
jgi:hypothetical protein